jgi:hypothetical protein
VPVGTLFPFPLEGVTENEVPEQMADGLIAEIIGFGFTVIVNVFEGPEQLTLPLVNVGVTVIVAITGEVPALEAVKEGILPVPEANNPILAASLVHA